MINKVPATINNCKGVPEQTKETLRKLGETFSSPTKVATKVAKALLFHGKSIWRDAKDAVSDFKDGEFESSGRNVGDAMKIIFLKRRQQSVMGVLDVILFIEGLAEGMLHDESIKLEGCIDDATELIAMIEKAFALLQGGDGESLIDRIVSGFKAFGEAFAFIPTLVVDCDEAGKAIKDVLD